MPSSRLFVFGAPNAPFAKLLTDLTGNAPISSSSGSLAGASHEWNVKTQYYTATVPIWIDELNDVNEWREEFLKPEAKEVVEAVGAWVYCFDVPARGQPGQAATGDAYTVVEKTMQAIQTVLEEHHSCDKAAVLAVRIPNTGEGQLAQDQRERLDDICIDCGFELVDYVAKGTNEFGEKQGFERMKEALEASQWSGTGDDGLDDPDFDLEQDNLSQTSLDLLSKDQAEFTAELFGLKTSLLASDSASSSDAPALDAELVEDSQAAEVENLEFMMSKLLAVREQAADMPEEQRKKVAAMAVQELLSRDVGHIRRGSVAD